MSAENAELTQLICSETERIAGLVDRFEQFSETPVDLDTRSMFMRYWKMSDARQERFGAHVSFIEDYDPSLPDVRGNKDLLTQVFLNLVKNAAEAVDKRKGEIRLCSAFRPGIRLSLPGRARQSDCRLSLASLITASVFPTTSNRICSTRLSQRNRTARTWVGPCRKNSGRPWWHG